MSVVRLGQWLSLSQVSPDIVLAQFKELQRQVPLLYALLAVNSVAVAYSHFDVAPGWMTLAIPALLISASLARLLVWLKRRGRQVDATAALRQLRLTIALAVLLALAYVCWALGLTAYGGPYEQAHVAVFVAVTVIGCIFCLMHLPQAALIVTAAVFLPFLTFYLLQGHPVFVSISLNVGLVALVMLQVLFNSFRGFREVIVSRGEMERLSCENLRLAHTDALVGLPNRRHFFSELEQRVEKAAADGRPLVVGTLDLDRFKAVNDTYGHLLGDKLLEQVGERLRTAGGEGVLVARLGGDEFGFLIDADEGTARSIAERLCHAIALPFDLDGISAEIGASCGAAVFPDGGTTAHELFDHADYALYHSKSQRRGTATFYSAEHETQIKSERAIESALRTANLDGEMDLHLQPVVDGQTGRVVAVEALARWQSPALGNIRPDIFITVAERTGLIQNVTLVLLGKALSLLERLPPELKLSFNLSTHDVTNSATMIALTALVRRRNIDPSRLIIELTETAIMRDFEMAQRSIQLLRSLGVEIALDDFGTGYSSLNYLNRLSVDKVKVDRSFVHGCDTEQGLNILRSILALCSSMGLNCIVEGVEEAEQLTILRDLGYRDFQGFLFGRPMPIDELANWLDARDDFSAEAEQSPDRAVRGSTGHF
ncbi:putative bifunctional diguanylate cyclase/phosphodiesterase [Jiella pelagia]|uniref:EAL domain-containing protein n=1 Tax=Jiella pelagia TaxID=2986949 RepID=A0ABY7C0W0_9HYPH|nr:EAL domain-containing protein [Jiella pelagia]WAP68856.1 EAL domain-containing protein [Jiella pelagia]